MDKVLLELCVDESQIFLSGSSNGGMLGYQLVSKLPIFAGFGNKFTTHYSAPFF